MDTVTPHHRRFRFALRTTFVEMTVLAILCAGVAFQCNWIQQRKQARVWLVAQTKCWYAPSIQGAKATAPAPWILHLFGEQGVVGIGMDFEQFAGPVPYTPAQLRRLFPEARVNWSSDGRFVIAP